MHDSDGFHIIIRAKELSMLEIKFVQIIVHDISILYCNILIFFIGIKIFTMPIRIPFHMSGQGYRSIRITILVYRPEATLP